MIGDDDFLMMGERDGFLQASFVTKLSSISFGRFLHIAVSHQSALQ